VTEVEEHIALEGDRLVLDLSARNVALIRREAGDLATSLEYKTAIAAWPLGWRFYMKRFPAAYESRREQVAYLERHDAAIRAELTAAAHRVIAAVDAGRPVRYPVAEADDLIRVLGVARNAARKEAVANYLSAVQHDIVVTLRPELIGVGPQ
jgi:hypothetical protein